MVIPCLRASQPMPPPSVRPPRPTDSVSPNGVAIPYVCAAVVYSPAVAPPWAEPIQRIGSMSTALQRAHVEQQAAVRRPEPGHAVTTALDRQLEAELARREDRPRHVDRVGGADDDARLRC